MNKKVLVLSILCNIVLIAVIAGFVYSFMETPKNDQKILTETDVEVVSNDQVLSQSGESIADDFIQPLPQLEELGETDESIVTAYFDVKNNLIISDSLDEIKNGTHSRKGAIVELLNICSNIGKADLTNTEYFNDPEWFGETFPIINKVTKKDVLESSKSIDTFLKVNGLLKDELYFVAYLFKIIDATEFGILMDTFITTHEYPQDESHRKIISFFIRDVVAGKVNDTYCEKLILNNTSSLPE